MSEFAPGNPDSLPSPVLRTCQELPATIASSVVDALPVGLLVVHNLTQTCYANAFGRRLLELLEAGFPSAQDGSAITGLDRVLTAAVLPEEARRISIQFPNRSTPSLFKTTLIAIPSNSNDEWRVCYIEPDGCDYLLDCPNARLWIPLLFGQATDEM